MNNLFLNWSDDDVTGINVIDEQHRAIMGIINSFFFHRLDSDIERFLVPTVDAMKALGLIHFRTEEQLMLDSGYPGYEEHAAEHQLVREELWAIERESRKTNDAMGFLFHLKSYWQKHVGVTDRLYVEHINNWLKDNS